MESAESLSANDCGMTIEQQKDMELEFIELLKEKGLEKAVEVFILLGIGF